MSQELEVLKIVTQRLQKGKIPYMITGSIATSFYAVPRMTRDIDIVIEIKTEDADRLLTFFEKDFYIDRDSVIEAIDQKGMFNVIHNEYVLKIDFIVRKDSSHWKLEFERRRPIEIEGVPMWVVSPEDLILSKLFWAKDSLSEMQLGDVKNLLNMVKDIDIRYVGQGIQSLGLEEIYSKVKV